MPVTVPPVQLDDVAKAKVSDQIKYMLGHDDGGRGAPKLLGVLDQRSQRGPMQVVEVGMGNEHEIDWRQIADPHSGLAQSFQDKKPARKIRIDDDVLAAHLKEKTGVSNESHTQLAIGYQYRLVWLSNSASPPSAVPGARTAGRVCASRDS